MPTFDQIPNLSDNELWGIVHQNFALPQDTRLRELTALGKQGALTAANQAELDALIEAYDQFVLIRSQALLTLKQHGYDVEKILRFIT